MPLPANDDDAATENCPHIAAHALFGPKKHTVAQKEALVWDKDHPELENEPHPMGLFKASELVDAFEQVEASGPGPYHRITNNCADLHINLAKKLGVTVDAQAVAYVSQRLLQDAGSSFLQYVRESWSGRRSLKEDDMVQKVVEERVVDLTRLRSRYGSFATRGSLL